MSVQLTADMTIGQRLEALRAEAGMSLIDVTFAIRTLSPDNRAHWLSHETIRRWEQDKLPEDEMCPFCIMLLAVVYNVDPYRLSHTAAHRFDSIYLRVRQSGWFDGTQDALATRGEQEGVFAAA